MKVFPTVRLGALRPLRIVQAALAAAAFAAAVPGAATAQGVSKGMHGDWETRCDKPPGAQGEVCSMMQFVTAEDRDNVGLTGRAVLLSGRDFGHLWLGWPQSG